MIGGVARGALAAGAAAALLCTAACGARSSSAVHSATETSSASSGAYRPAASGDPIDGALPATNTADEATTVGLREALASCAFDWRQSLDERTAAAARYTTVRYATELRKITPDERSRWLDTQHEHAVGRCSVSSAYLVTDAPNTAASRFVRVSLLQTVTAPGLSPSTSTFVTTFQVLRQHDRWLVGAEIDGGS